MAGSEKNKNESGRPALARRGASQQAVTFREKFDSYLQNHRLVARDSINRLWNHPVASLMTFAVIAIAMALPTGFYVLLDNAQAVTKNWEGRAQISLFLAEAVDENQGHKLSQALLDRNDIEKTEFISKEQALKEFEEVSGMNNVLQGLTENPLPSVIIIYPKTSDPGQIEKLRNSLAELVEVELAQLDSQWVKRLHSILNLGQRIVAALTIGLVMAVILVIVNTIGLAIENRKEEIIITKLVGATDSFVRRPFLYTGLWYGAGGGLLALIMVESVLVWLNNPVKELAGLYDAEFGLSGLGVLNGIGLLIPAAIIGLVGAWIAVGRHLREIEPE